MRRGLLAAGLGAVTAIAVVTAFAWLGREDALAPCPVAVVLNGDHPGRADEAAALYRDGALREIWLTDDPRSSAGGIDSGTVSNVRRLVSRGVPAEAIHVVDGAARGTRAELRAVRSAADRRGVPCVVVVTSPAHAARVKVVWWRLDGTKPRLVVRTARGGRYAGWRADARELALTLGALAGVVR